MAIAKGKAGSVPYSPHIHSGLTIEKVMWNVVLALLPAGAASIWFFGYNSIRIIGISLLTALVTEFAAGLLMKKPWTILDGSAVITGLLFAYSLPPAAHWYVIAAGSFFSIAIVKWAFGGLGYNFMNPAIGGRIFVVAAWSGTMIGQWSPTIDAVSAATPLNLLKYGGIDTLRNAGLDNLSSLFLGNVPGCIGETSKAAILIGAIYLIIRKIINWEIPVIYIGTAALLAWIFGAIPSGGALFEGNPLVHILSGGLFLGAFFMATDPVTSPITFRGRALFAVMLGVITIVIRLWGGYPEGTSYAIALMNIFVPLIDSAIKDRIYGHSKALEGKAK